MGYTTDECRNIAVTASFMFAGCDCFKDNVLELWGNGCIKLAVLFADYAMYCALYCEQLVFHHQTIPGVFDYEVSEQFGVWFRNQLIDTGNAPDVETGMAELKRRVEEFFAQ